MTITEAKQQAKATVFVNINGEAQTTPDRRLGWWRIDSRKLEKVKTVLVVQDDVVVLATEDLEWTEQMMPTHTTGEEGEVMKKSYKGTHINHPWLGERITGWDVQQSVTYSDDVV
jgi:hypothetical protein